MTEKQFIKSLSNEKLMSLAGGGSTVAKLATGELERRKTKRGKKEK